MQLVFDVRERQAGPGDVVSFPFTLNNDSDRPVDCTYSVIAEEDDFDTDWCRLSAPVRVSPGARESAELHVQLPEGAVGPDTYHVHVQVRTDGAAGEDEDVCVVVVPPVRCARFPAVPTLRLTADGNVTASIRILNCGNLELDCSIDVRHKDGWLFQVEDGQLKLNVDAGPVEVRLTYRPPLDQEPSGGDEVRIEIRVDGVVVADTSAYLQPPPSAYSQEQASDGPWKQWVALVLVTLVLLLVVGLWVLASAMDDDDDVTPTTVPSSSLVPDTTLRTTSSSGPGTTTSSSVVAPRFSVSPTPVERGYPVTISLTNTGNNTITVGTPQLSGRDATAFEIDRTNCSSARLGPGASCSVTVGLTPSGGDARYEATLLIPVEGAAQPGRAALTALVVG